MCNNIKALLITIGIMVLWWVVIIYELSSYLITGILILWIGVGLFISIRDWLNEKIKR